MFHCPFCHGWEVRDRPLGVLDRGADGVHRALLLRAWSDDVTLLTDGPAELEPPTMRASSPPPASASTSASISRVGRPGRHMTAVAFADGTSAPLGPARGR